MGLLTFILRCALLGSLGFVWLLAGIFLYLSPNLPDVETLRDVELQTPMRVYTRNGDLIGQFGEQKRNPLRFPQIPEQFVQALLAAEDDNFFNHRGIDVMGLARAVSELVLTGEKVSGGSTLTMQVARNYFLSFERTFIRKFNEILLAIQIERHLDKSEIFELYFNRIFLGHRAYGFEAAAQVYYGKSIRDLDLAQHAMLAGIPKAPSRNNPLSSPEAGKNRRNWILGRMHSLGYIDAAAMQEARLAPVTAVRHGTRINFSARYAAEMARQELLERFGDAAYTRGFHVYTTIDTTLQQAARTALLNGLFTYDKRHGYRGPERQLPPHSPTADMREEWLRSLKETAVIAGLEPAIVSAINAEDNSARLLLRDGSNEYLAFTNGVDTARPFLSENSRGPAPTSMAQVFSPGDLIRVARNAAGELTLAQVPAAQSALVALNPNNGAILSIVGGMGFELSKFNRATQSRRQPGSNFKPFVYSAALEHGFTAASIINDAPIVLEDNALENVWRPENDSGEFYGPTRLRWALTKSRNLVSIRLLQQLGVKKLLNYVSGLGLKTEGLNPDLSLALGTLAMSPLEVASAYAIIANGGYRVEPYLIERIEDLDGNVLFQADPLTVCDHCDDAIAEPDDELSMEEILAGGTPEPVNAAPRVMDERVNFIIDSILKDVITRGTGRKAKVLGRSDIAGKTGTTNGPMDAWFSGYTPAIAATSWVGFDNYTPLGRREFGGTAALPIWIDYMRVALEKQPESRRPLPDGIVNVKIDPRTGLLARAGQPDAIFEFFREEYVPQERVRESDVEQSGTLGTEDLIKDIF